MRKFFTDWLYNKISQDKNVILCTGDLGFGLFDKIRYDYPDQFINFSSSEQLMVGAACGMSLEGKIPYVYSITPFVIYRPFELIRNYIDHESMNVKLIGGGRSRDYGYLGFSHWADEDLEVMSVFKNINSYHSEDDEIEQVLENSYNNKTPYYINLKR
jgi:transketolase